MKPLTVSIYFYLTLLTGILLVFIGIRFLVAPAVAEAAFGIHVPANGNFSFHDIKGIRDLFTGLVVIILLLRKEYSALGSLLVLSTMIPVMDFTVVLRQPGHATASLYPHAIAVILCVVLGSFYLRFTAKK
ncbi:DUF4267 domain-containing protein [Chitinophaga nivalis]|uniref:DUF4267 domain-containing protein n=1 Tax=Chitinophaga nivalis TaxID=2991709 RepID=A0ABT3ITE9_9BACT|nr:DUF4267 domain-containing protein [Chitinophaga nivalis]MCW3463046.1 DUF4267 domain-containing protein [Chitinophaga nivalis]MCW3487264.1 DUF4267 domain-containing protein [Chitinophaga nivalis]